MSEFSKLSDAIHKEDLKNAELIGQIQRRTDEMLAAFWMDYPKLEMVEKLELNVDILLEWVKHHPRK